MKLPMPDDLDPTSQRAVTTEAVDRTVIQQAMARFVGDSLPPIALGLGLLYVLFFAAHTLLLTGSMRLIMSSSAAVSAALLLIFWYVWRRYAPPTHYAHMGAAFFATLVLINSWLHLWLTRDPLQTTNLMLLVVGVGFFFLSGRWFGGFLLITFIIWAGTFYTLGVAIDEVTHFGFGLFSASLLATLAHWARKHTLTRLTLLRQRDAQRTADLQQALTASQGIETALRHSEMSYRQLSLQLEEQAEALRVANNELARAARLKDEFLANMSHELRTPLTAILGLTESLRENVYGELAERQRTAIHNVYESGQHLLELINDILDVAKTEAGKLELDLLPADIHMIAEVSLRFCQPEAEKKGLTVTYETDRQVTLLLADERRLKQILVNLLSNAVKFTAEGGRIGLRLSGDLENETVRYTVWDSGIGISPEQMKQLFKPFIQLDSRLARRYAGTGLGLVLVYRLAELHGGSVTLRSQPGAGSEFIVTLPWRKMAPRTEEQRAQVLAEAPPDAEPALSAPQPTALVVDDQQTSRSWLIQLLNTAGYTVWPASTTADALRLVREVQPEVIFVDLQLSGEDTFSLIRTLTSGKARSCPVIALSALVLPGEAEQATAAGATAYFAKPLGRQALHHIIERPANCPTG
jgi:signal transduction histidine kinase